MTEVVIVSGARTAVGRFGGAFKDVVPFVVLLAILIVRPHGLFGTPEIERL